MPSNGTFRSARNRPISFSYAFPEAASGEIRNHESAAVVDHADAERAGQRVAVLRPLESVRGAGFSGHVGRHRAGSDGDLVALGGERVAADRDRRAGDVGDQIDAFAIVPFARNAEADVRLVLMVGDDDLDRLTEQRARQNPRSRALRPRTSRCRKCRHKRRTRRSARRFSPDCLQRAQRARKAGCRRAAVAQAFLRVICMSSPRRLA